jgi:hypothetical protein
MSNCDNPARGANFERAALQFFGTQGLELQVRHSVQVGAGSEKKIRTFDLGSTSPPTLVECKCHRWTEGGNAPSAKLSVWNEAMFYFLIAPPHYRKILATLADSRRSESIADHYVRRFRHLVPRGVEIWELSEDGVNGRLVFTGD